jgi:hypothetical protein
VREKERDKERKRETDKSKNYLEEAEQRIEDFSFDNFRTSCILNKTKLS